MIRYHADGVGMPKLARLINRQWLREVCGKYDRKVGDIVFVFTNDQTIISLNKEFNMKDCATDVLTFRYREDGVINGEVFICLDSVRFNAGRAGVPVMRELKENPQKFYDKYYNITNQRNEEQL